MQPEKAVYLAGSTGFDIERIKHVAERVAESRIYLLIAPVFIPGINDENIPELIQFALEIGARKRWPELGIQKYEHYRLGRSPGKVRPQSWWQFYNQSMAGWEKQFSIPLRLKLQDFGIERRPMILTVFEKKEKTWMEIRAPGWVRGEMLGVARNRVVSVMDCPVERGSVRVRIVSKKHNIYVAVPC